jgi:hypothetical protein
LVFGLRWGTIESGNFSLFDRRTAVTIATVVTGQIPVGEM